MTKPIPVYSSSIFRVNNVQAAKSIILTREDGVSTEERWVTETPWLVDEIGARMNLRPESTLLDFGCGIGRVAKGLIDRYGCSVIGVDISPEMRQMAVPYVGSDRFRVYSPQAFGYQVRAGLRVDAAYSVWVLQHVAAPTDDLALIHAALTDQGLLYVVNDHRRIVPTSAGWVNDRQDIHAIMAARFDTLAEGAPPETAVTPALHANSFWKLMARR